MQPRTRPAICLGPTGNFQGLTEFKCEETRLKIVHRNYTKLPMIDLVKEKVNLLAKRDMAEMGVILRNRYKKNFDFWNEEFNPMPNKNAENENGIYPDIPAEFPGTFMERDTEVDVIMGPQTDDEANIEAAEAERNCDPGEILVANGRESDEQNDGINRS